jgi:hypothetical protein
MNETPWRHTFPSGRRAGSPRAQGTPCGPRAAPVRHVEPAGREPTPLLSSPATAPLARPCRARTVTWPPAPIELFASPEVRTYLGGPRSRDGLGHAVPEQSGPRPGDFVVALDGAMIGTITLLDRRDATRPGHIHPEAREAELGYLRLARASSTALSRSGELGCPETCSASRSCVGRIETSMSGAGSASTRV